MWCTCLFMYRDGNRLNAALFVARNRTLLFDEYVYLAPSREGRKEGGHSSVDGGVLRILSHRSPNLECHDHFISAGQ